MIDYKKGETLYSATISHGYGKKGNHRLAILRATVVKAGPVMLSVKIDDTDGAEWLDQPSTTIARGAGESLRSAPYWQRTEAEAVAVLRERLGERYELAAAKLAAASRDVDLARAYVTKGE